MIEKFMAKGAAPPKMNQWKLVKEQLNQEMNLVMEIE